MGRKVARRGSNKEINDLVQKARSQGWTVLHSGGGHLIFRSPDKTVPQIVVAGTPGGGNRSVENTIARLRKAGLSVNHRRRMRRNPTMSTGAMVAIGAGAVLALALLSRPRTVATTVGPIPADSAARVSAVMGANREAEIARAMARRPGMTRAEAEARYDRAVAMMTTMAAALTRPAANGIGSYYRS
jgi:biotin operon repressor